MYHKTQEQISYNMRQIKSSGTHIEDILAEELIRRGITTFERNDITVFGKPDFVFKARKIAVFCDGDFWHGYDWINERKKIHSNAEFWTAKIESNMAHDKQVNTKLSKDGWTVFRFWGHDIKRNAAFCADKIEKALRSLPQFPYKTVDLCAGIGGIRRGFELTGHFINVLSSEVDRFACITYKHLFGDDPYNDLTSEEFKDKTSKTQFDVLLAGFPCQTFSRVGKEEGFADKTKGQIFFHIAEIIRNTRPMVVFLENVDRLVTHDNGNTFRIIIDKLVNDLGYHVIGVDKTPEGHLNYNTKSFVRNSRDFGVPQNRPRTYIIAFDTERFEPKKLNALPTALPRGNDISLYRDLNELLDHNVDAKYYMSSGYLATLEKHKARQESKGYGFGYRVVNDPSINNPVANTLLATGGSGKERNLIYDPRSDIGGKILKGKKTPLNDKGIRVMTPSEWGKLQGFINYAFVDNAGNEFFSFPKEITDAQQYKQFGNSVTVPVIRRMAEFVIECLSKLSE